MKQGISYLFGLILISSLLFWIANNVFDTDNPLIAFFLAMIVSHLILEKNQWLIDFENESEKNKS